jgi:hypothetical protein
MGMRCRRNLGFPALVATLMATCLQFGGCSLGGIARYFANFNPCGTILNCDPVQYQFVRSGYRGPGADPDVDLACTYPPFCGTSDPFTSYPNYVNIVSGTGGGARSAPTATTTATTSSSSSATSGSTTGSRP